MSHGRRVTVFVERYLQPEQTFIFRQMIALPDAEVRYLVRHVVPGHRFPMENVTPFGSRRLLSPRWAWRRDRLVRAATGRYAALGWRESRRLQRLLAASRPDIVHAHWAPDAMLIAPACRQLAIPLLVHFHGYDVWQLGRDGVYRASLLRLYNRMAIALTVSKHMRDGVIHLGCPREKVRCHYTGVPEEFFRIQPRRHRPGARWILLQVGRLVEVKGHRHSLEAMAAAVRRWPQLVLRIVGDGPLRETLEAQAERMGLRASVEFPGRLTSAAVLEELGRAQALLMPSCTASDGGVEGLPNAVVEALAAGVPVIATRHGGIEEAVQYPGATDWLAPEKDAAALEHRIGRLVSEPGLWDSFSTEGRKRARECFYLPTQSRRLRDLYATLASGRGTS